MQRNKTYRMLILPAILSLMVMFMAACGGNAAAPGGGTPAGSSKPAAAPASKQIIRESIGDSDFQSLDPALNQFAQNAIPAIYTGLVELNDKGDVIDQIAASHQISSDNLTYTFTLKPNLVFSDGTPLTAQDVAYSINRVIDPATKSPIAFYLRLVKDYDQLQASKVKTLIGDSIVVKDPNTISITISKPAAFFLQALSFQASWVVEKKLIDQYGATWTDHLDQGGGDGPFKVQSYSHTKGLTLIPNPNYYGPKPQIQQYIMTITGDLNTTWNSYLSGQLDWAAVPSAKIDTAKTMPGFVKAPALVISYITMNYLIKPLDNIKIRQALALAINKDLLVHAIRHDTVEATNHIVPKGMAGYNPDLKGPDGTTSTAGNPDMAKQLFAQGLQEEGYANAAALPTLTINTSTGSQQRTDLLNAITDQWKSVLGITVKVALLDATTEAAQELASANNPKGLQMWYAGWQADYPDPQDWLSLFFQKGADNNQSNYGQNKAADAADQQAVQDALVQADVNQDVTSRMKAYNDAEQKIINDVGWIPLFQIDTLAVMNPKIQNYTGFTSTAGVVQPSEWDKIYVAA